MSFVIFGDIFTFPEGSAATNRVYTYAKGFIENGIPTHVICFSNNYMEQFDGVVEGIPYYHPFRQKARNPSFFVRRWQNFRKYVNTYKTLKKIHKEDKIIAVNSWANRLQTHLIIWLMCKMIGTKLVVECSEHPLRFYQGGALNRMAGKIKFFIESHMCSGVFCISRYLVNFYSSRGIKERRLLLVPSTVDPSRFTEIVKTPRPFDKPYVGYFGSLTFKRDNVDLLINAFGQFSKINPAIHLVLGGFCSPDEKKQIIDLVAKNNITERVTILGYVTRQEILSYVFHADALVLVRCNDLEAEASYPSKLTEFLATGKPVITVNVGEIADFIIHKENGFLVPHSNVEALSSAMEQVFNNYEAAKQAGQKGKELTNGVFNYNYQSKRMIEFIHSL